MKKTAILLFFLLHFSVFSQGEANIWYFGQSAGLDFNSGSPLPLLDSQLNSLEGCSVLSNNLGQLMFYTDGTTIYNKNHMLMLNGDNLMGDDSTTQSSTIIQKPGSSNLFYIFTLDDLITNFNGFRYTIVDMSLDNGLGGVTIEKNILINTPSSEKISIAKHSNNIDYWIVTHSFVGNTFFSHLLTSSGLNTNPITVNIGPNFPLNDNQYNAGCLKFSPSGKKLAMASKDVIGLMDFDTTTGKVSNFKQLYTGSSSYGVEFSPNNKVLYASVGLKQIFQFDLTSTDIPNSKIGIKTLSSVFNLQLGPDLKIYIANYDSDKLSVISNPNIVGNACNFQDMSISLGGRKCFLGLPSFNQSLFNKPLIELVNSCVGENINFSFTSDLNVLNTTWDFGDGNISSGNNPSHIYQSANNFIVTISITTPSGTLTNTRNIIIHPKPILLQNNLTLKQCDDNNDGFSFFNLKETEQLLVTNTAVHIFSYHETLSQAESGTFSIANLNAYSNQIINNDVVFVRVANSNGCYQTAQINLVVSTTSIPSSFQKVFQVCDTDISGSDIDGISTFDFSSATQQIEALFPVGQLIRITYYKNLADALAQQNDIVNISNYTNTGSPNTQNIYIRVENQANNDCLGLGNHITLIVNPIPKIKSTGTETVCSNDPNITKIIDAGLSNTSSTNTHTFQWILNGNILPGETNYSLTINTTGIYTVVTTNSLNCSKTRTINVTTSNIATIINVEITDLSYNNSIIVSVSGNGNYEYSLDGVTYQTSNVFNNVVPGVYKVYVNDINGCGITEKEIRLLGIPNYFTPNGDGYNDYWNIKGINDRYNAKTTIHIFDRYGKLLKQISPLSSGWDGTYNGKQMPSSDYWYHINLEDGRIFKGHFSLKR